MSDFNAEKTPGTFGEPPPNAPRESTMPLSQEALSIPAGSAQNERVLPPFDPPKMGLPPPQTLHANPRTTERSHQPAASNSDSPSRGIPQPILDPGKKITGGFGHAGEAQYFPLDGSELRELVRSLMDSINTRLENDLRFHVAVTYPRVRARVVVQIEAYAQPAFDEIERVVEHTKTPIEIARELADKVVFVVVEQRQEMTPDGQAEDPPDRIREDLGLEAPRKQQVELPGHQRMFVDRVAAKLDNTF